MGALGWDRVVKLTISELQPGDRVLIRSLPPGFWCAAVAWDEAAFEPRVAWETAEFEPPAARWNDAPWLAAGDGVWWRLVTVSMGAFDVHGTWEVEVDRP